MRDSNTVSGAGPWTFESPALDPDEPWSIDLESWEKGKIRRHMPADEMLVKNYDPDSRIDVVINGTSRVDVDPNGKDSYDETKIRLFKVVNRGGTVIDAGDVTLTLRKDPYDADEAARERKQTPPLQRVVKSKLGLM